MILLYIVVYFLFIYEANKILIYKTFEVQTFLDKLLLLAILILFPYIIVLISFYYNISEIFKNRSIEDYQNQN